MDRRSFFRKSTHVAIAGAALSAGALAAQAVPQKRKIIHLEIGNERWQPTAEELSEVVRQFQLADADPMGSIVGTRDGVRVTVL